MTRTSPSRAAFAALLLAGLAACTHPKLRSTPMTMQDDLAHRSYEIHWPEGFDPARADLFVHNEGFVAAPCERVWRHLVDAPAWPAWYPNAKDVRVVDGSGGGPLAAGAVFRWTTFGLAVESRVHEFEPHLRLGWFGAMPGSAPSFFHTWLLVPQGDGCRVITEEVGVGEAAAGLRRTDEGLLHRGHDLWLATLKWRAEGR